MRSRTTGAFQLNLSDSKINTFISAHICDRLYIPFHDESEGFFEHMPEQPDFI